MLGLKGDIAGSWTFDAFASYDQSVHDQTMHHAVLKTQVQRLLSAADGGASLCAGGFNPFGDANARSLSLQCQDFITKDAFSNETLSQTQFQAQVSGTSSILERGRHSSPSWPITAKTATSSRRMRTSSRRDRSTSSCPAVRVEISKGS